MKFDRSQLLLYAVTDRGFTGELTLIQQIEQALRGGVTMLQLREKELDREHFLSEAAEVKELCHRFGVPLIINDKVEVALAIGADGVHVGMDDMPVDEIRKKVGQDFIIGATAKTPEQARAAQAAGADYLGVGAVFPSPTKKNALRITPEMLRSICNSVTIPSVAIGGINLDNVSEIKGCPIAGIAVVSAIFGAADIEKAAAELKAVATEIVGKENVL